MGLLSSIFGGGGSSKSTSTSLTKTMDQRIGVEGGLGGGTLVGPESNVATPGSIATRVGDFSTMTQTITGNKFRVGMTGAEVKDLLVQESADSTAALGVVKDFSQQALNAVTSAKIGETTEWTKYLPLVIIGVVALAAVKRRRTG